MINAVRGLALSLIVGWESLPWLSGLGCNLGKTPVHCLGGVFRVGDYGEVDVEDDTPGTPASELEPEAVEDAGLPSADGLAAAAASGRKSFSALISDS